MKKIALLFSLALLTNINTAEVSTSYWYKMANKYCTAKDQPFKTPSHKLMCRNAAKEAIANGDDELLKITGTIDEIMKKKVLEIPKTEYQLIEEAVYQGTLDAYEKIKEMEAEEQKKKEKKKDG